MKKHMTKNQARKYIGDDKRLGEPDIIRIVKGQETHFYEVARLDAIKHQIQAERDRQEDERRQQNLKQYARVLSGDLITQQQVKDEFNLHGHDLGDVRKVEVYHPDKQKHMTYYDRAHAERLAKALQGQGLILKTHAMKEYGLTRAQIEQIEPIAEKINQNHRSGPTLKLYSRDEIEAWVADDMSKRHERP